MPTLDDLARRVREEHPAEGPPRAVLERRNARRVRTVATLAVAIAVGAASVGALFIVRAGDSQTRSVVAQPREPTWVDYVDPPAPIGAGFTAEYPSDWTEPVGRSNLNTRLSNDMVTMANYPIRAGGATCGSLPANALADLPR